jgi:hypothetical protein
MSTLFEQFAALTGLPIDQLRRDWTEMYGPTYTSIPAEDELAVRMSSYYEVSNPLVAACPCGCGGVDYCYRFVPSAYDQWAADYYQTLRDGSRLTFQMRIARAIIRLPDSDIPF